MFQQTIQDVLALAEAGNQPESVLETVRVRIGTFELFEGGEIVAQAGSGLRRFPIASGLGDVGPRALEALGDEPTLRVDTAAGMKTLGLSNEPGLGSMLALRLSGPGASKAAIVLCHSRAWSFAGTPLTRVRTIGQVALRLLLSSEDDGRGSGEVTKLQAEVQQLRAQVRILENDVIELRAKRGKKR